MNKEKFLNDLKPCITDNQKLKVHNNALLDLLDSNIELSSVSNGEFVNEVCALENTLDTNYLYAIVIEDLNHINYTSFVVLRDNGAYINLFDVNALVSIYLFVTSNEITAYNRFGETYTDLNEYGVTIYRICKL